MLSPALVAKGFTFEAADVAGCSLCFSRCLLAVISDYGRYFEIIFAVSPGRVEKFPSFIACIRVRFFGSRVSDDKNSEVLLGFWVVYSGVPWRHWFNVLAPVFYCALFQNILLFVVLDWMMKREAP